jgi:hypothetical protein
MLSEADRKDSRRKKDDAPPSFFHFASAVLPAGPGVALLLPRLLYPMQMDQYFHHYLGWRLIHGGLPYIASFDQNFPGGAILYAIGIAIFGQSSLGFAVFDLLVQALACYLIARLALRFDRTGLSAWLGPMVYALVYVGLGAWDVGQRDSFIAPMLLAFLLILTRERISSRAWMAAGFLIGTMALTRPLFILAAVPVFLAWFWTSKRLGDLARTAIASAVLPLGIVVLYAALGHLTDLYEATIAFNLDVYSKFRHGVNLRGSGSMSIVLAVGIFLYALSRPRIRDATLLLSALVIAPLSTWIQGQGDPHHTTPSYAVASLLSALGLSWAIRMIRTRTSTVVGSLAVVTVIALILWRGVDREPLHLVGEYLHGEGLQSLYAQQSRGDVKLTEEFAVSDYMRTHTKSTDPIYIFSMRIWPYELADRLPPTRFQSPEHLIMQPADQPLTQFQVRWRREFIGALKMNPPRYILITTTDQMWLYPHAEASLDQVKRFPEFQEILRDSYAQDTVIGAFVLYRRRS